MNKIAIIIGREYFSRVKQRMFLIATFGLPILLIGFYALLAFIMLKEDTTERTIAIINRSNLEKPLQTDENTTYKYVAQDTDYKILLENNSYYAVLVLPEDIEASSKGELYSNRQVPAEVSREMSSVLSEIIRQKKLTKLTNELAIPELEKKVEATKTRITLTNVRLKDGEEKESSSGVAQVLSFMAMAVGFVIFFLVMTYGSIVMRGVVEEKSNRIVEVIISSIKPYQLMLGKILGIALVGITQIVLWGLMLGVAYIIAVPFLAGMITPEAVEGIATQNQPMVNSAMGSFMQDITGGLDFGVVVKLLVVSFVYAILGYLLYASLFAAVGAAADNETDTQQLSTPLMLPLMIGFYMAFNVSMKPESSMAFWSSIVPFTSPLVMPARIPFDVPWWELLLSLGILVLTILGCVLLAAKIYRTGILMYGKKVTFKEMFKWLRHS